MALRVEGETEGDFECHLGTGPIFIAILWRNNETHGRARKQAPPLPIPDWSSSTPRHLPTRFGWGIVFSLVSFIKTQKKIVPFALECHLPTIDSFFLGFPNLVFIFLTNFGLVPPTCTCDTKPRPLPPLPLPRTCSFFLVSHSLDEERARCARFLCSPFDHAPFDPAPFPFLIVSFSLPSFDWVFLNR